MAGFRQRRDEVTGSYFFSAHGPDGSVVGYSLEVTGTAVGPVVPGTGNPNPTTTLTWTGGLMHVDGDGVGCVGGGGKHSAQKT